MEPLIQLLRNSSHPNEPRTLSNAAKHSLKIIEKKIALTQCYRYRPNRDLAIAVYGPEIHQSAVIIQTTDKEASVLEWVFPPVRPTSSLQGLMEATGQLLLKARNRTRLVFGKDPRTIYLPWKSTELLELWMQECPAFAVATLGITLSIHYPLHPLFKTSQIIQEQPKITPTPLSAITVFTNASGKTGKYGCAWLQDNGWEKQIRKEEGVSVQVLELKAVLMALELFEEDLNVVTDSAYVAGLVERCDHALVGQVSNPHIEQLLWRLVATVEHRKGQLWISHVRSHTTLPGVFAEGNAIIDQAVSQPLAMTVNTPQLSAAYKSHKFFHQSARALQKEFILSRTQARAILAACPDCARVMTLQDQGTNPRGLQPRGIWQMDVTDLPSFGRLRHVHVMVDTCSRAVWATAAPSTAFRYAKQHWLSAFAALGLPKTIKTDNAPAYTNTACNTFLSDWGIEHKTEIPYNSMGQAIVERRHQDIKHLASILKKEGKLSPQAVLMKTCYVLNWKNPVGDADNVPMDYHLLGNPHDLSKWVVGVEAWDPGRGNWEGKESRLRTWGRGYACIVSDSSDPRWLPAKWVRPWLRTAKTPKADDATEQRCDSDFGAES